ncbi:polyphenol oxidase I, chloroplastic-like [Apium graveolens]|uniref:polyphenol oxidase I, chloroplastic-like n=1 Tax=Apium graveolens TaxID=4045 RepID=UPI003D79E534
MASFALPTTVAHLSKTTQLSSAASFSSPTTTTSQLFLNQKCNHLKKSLSCRAAKDSSDQEAASNNTGDGKFDRRDILLGLGGLYGTTAVSGAAFAAPVDVTKCGEATTLPGNVTKIDCCPPPNPNIIDFAFPSRSQPLRIRPAAHMLDAKYIAKFNKAMQLMRDLPKDDPHSFAQQAAIHCAYCDSSYQMVGFPNKKIDVHFSWLFFPFHRWYLYFYEKILGKLIDDPTFGLPFWNWDSPDGAAIPAIFADPKSPLYDNLRDALHQPPLKADLNYSKKVPSPTDLNELIKSNNTVMYNQMVSSSKTAELFFGKPYRAGDDQIKGQGSIENIPHTQIHIWTGDPNQPNGEDMGRFYSAGRDPIFYSHHSNVDRMWNIWKTLPGKNRKDITDTDYLDSAFLFYDENKQLVRVKVRDCLDTKKMGYIYQDVPLPWLRSRPVRKTKKPKKGGRGSANAAEAPTPILDASALPKVLDGILKVNVPRPKKSRTQEEKEDEEEILEIDGIEYDGDEYIKFDVYINDEDEVDSGPQNAEFAGAFSNVPFKVSKKVKTSLSLGITELLEDLGADDDEGLVVALVPRTGKGKVTIGSVKIRFSS